ncbi:40S ribosomal protein S4, partial [Massospora cicadina]
ARGPKKHLKRLNAPKHWMFDKLTGSYAPRPSAGPHKLRVCLPLIIFIRNRLKYALNAREVTSILISVLLKLMAKYALMPPIPLASWMLFQLKKLVKNFRLVYDTKGRFTIHLITDEEAK